MHFNGSHTHSPVACYIVYIANRKIAKIIWYEKKSDTISADLGHILPICMPFNTIKLDLSVDTHTTHIFVQYATCV